MCIANAQISRLSAHKTRLIILPWLFRKMAYQHTNSFSNPRTPTTGSVAPRSEDCLSQPIIA